MAAAHAVYVVSNLRWSRGRTITPTRFTISGSRVKYCFRHEANFLYLLLACKFGRSEDPGHVRVRYNVRQCQNNMQSAMHWLCRDMFHAEVAAYCTSTPSRSFQHTHAWLADFCEHPVRVISCCYLASRGSRHMIDAGLSRASPEARYMPCRHEVLCLFDRSAASS